MTDREIIELAAKAAGIAVDMSCERAWPQINSYDDDGVTVISHHGWNPIEDDGDAFRLAVTLGIFFRKDFLKLLGDLLNSGEERRSATRKAIVLTAAEIGRMKS